jgi:hypothetical protein
MATSGQCLVAVACLFAVGTTAKAGNAMSAARQLTHAPYGHVLTNINAWSPDSRWLVYDVRTGSSFEGMRIERVNIETGEVQCIYESGNGAACGVVTYHPSKSKVVFILGPENPSPDWTYGFSRRRGVIVDISQPGVAHPLEAANYAPPFVAGALRGGSHVHVFSPDGLWISFTYDDEVLSRLGEKGDHDINQRNVGVAVPAGPVRVNRNHPRNHDGDFFSALVTRTVNRPTPGSAEISRAYEEGWVGAEGYLRADGTQQKRALAFQGLVTTADGKEHAEVFVADLPDDLTVSDEVPLGGTETRRPAPPAGIVQRRLTYTAGLKYPGVSQKPRHWLRSSPDGAQIAFLMRDEAGVVQLWTVSPNGGEPRKVTHNPWNVSSAFTWSPDGRWVAHAMDRSVFLTEAATGRSIRLTERAAEGEGPLPHACVFSPDGRHLAYMQEAGPAKKQFPQIFVLTLSLLQPTATNHTEEVSVAPKNPSDPR